MGQHGKLMARIRRSILTNRTISKSGTMSGVALMLHLPSYSPNGVLGPPLMIDGIRDRSGRYGQMGALTPSASETCAVKPSNLWASAGEATTWRTSPSRQSPVMMGRGADRPSERHNSLARSRIV